MGKFIKVKIFNNREWACINIEEVYAIIPHYLVFPDVKSYEVLFKNGEIVNIYCDSIDEIMNKINNK